MKIRHEIWIFCKAQCSAQLATLADFCLSWLLADVLGLWYLLASFMGALTGGVLNGVFNYRWVFDGTGELNKRSVAVKYLMVWAGSILLNTLGTYGLTEWSGRHFMIAKAAVAVCVAVLWNYQMQRLYVYRVEC